MRRFLILAGILAIFAAPTMAQLPADQTVQLRFRQNPADPQSAVDFYVMATLGAVEISGTDVGWMITSVEFFQADGTQVKSWSESYPLLQTSDGLWWVTHTNPQFPELDEFLTMPLLEGRAFADNPADEDLDYWIVADPGDPSTPYENPANVTYALAPADTDEPVKQGSDEPVEIHDHRDMD